MNKYQNALRQIFLMRDDRYNDFLSLIKAYEELNHKKVSEEDIIFLCNTALK